MKKEDIELTLAEMLEPRPVDPSIADMCELKAWQFELAHDLDNDYPLVIFPRPLTGDYAMELLKEMPCPDVWKNWDKGWACEWQSTQSGTNRSDADTPEEAVALAYIAWKKSGK